MDVKKAIIPAAGLGARLKPLTDKIPKELFPLGKRLVMDYAIEEAVYSGIEEVCIVVRPGKAGIRERYGRPNRHLIRQLGQLFSFVNICFVEQQQSLGLGDAIWTAREFTGNQPFAVLLPDNVFVADVPPAGQLKRLFEQHPTCCVGTMRVPPGQAIFFLSSRKLLYQELTSGVYRVEQILDGDEYPVQAGEIRSIGRYILAPRFFDYCSKARDKVKGELRETDVLKEYLRDGNQLYGGLVEGQRFDTGSMEGYTKAFVSFVDRGL
jgi:UTP--glucose-1-phosphate uridylyltransferase